MKAYPRFAVVLLFFILVMVLLLIWLVSPKAATIQHPKHEVNFSKQKFMGRRFSVIELPHCEHLEIIVTYNPPGETKDQAKNRLQGIAVCTGPYYNPSTKTPVDKLKKNGKHISRDNAGRFLLVTLPDGKLVITKDPKVIEKADCAIALGQTLVPFSFDGFSRNFANRRVFRNAIGITSQHIYIVQTTSDLWRLSSFMKEELKCVSAINCDGGHAVNGKSPFHLVFRWKNLNLGGR